MSKKIIYFKGVLANVDSSILKLILDHGFSIEAVSDKRGINLISVLENTSFSEAGKKLFMEYPCLNDSERKLYFINNSFESSITETDGWTFSGVAQFDNKLIHGYLNPTIRLLRLFKEGDVRMPLKFYYTIDNNKTKRLMSFTLGRYVSRVLYLLESSEVKDLQKFIKETELPFRESFLQLAFDNFELSYETHNINLSFLTLMVSLETLLNPGKQELRYRISRNTAVLLGRDKAYSKKIFREIKDLYDKRSKIVHAGRSDVIKKEDLLKLRHYVRESIKKIYKIGMDKNSVIDLLNCCGFGEIEPTSAG